MSDQHKEIKILTPKQMSFCEKESENYGVSLAQLMDNAGKRLAERIIHICKHVKKYEKEAVMLIGKGNNGGDGLVAAKILKENGINPIIILCCGLPASKLAVNAFNNLPKEIKIYNKITDEVLLKIENSRVLIDCIFGTGFHGNLRNDIKPVFEACRRAESAYKIACDIPSGANSQNGHADSLTFKADLTVTFHRYKLGLLMSPCRYFASNKGILKNIQVQDIGIPCECEKKLHLTIKRLDRNYAKSILPKRLPYGHKGTFGKIISVCGSESYIGAAGISAISAMKTGIGLFELCTPKTVTASLSSRILECTYSAMDADENGFMTSKNAQKILEKCKKADCLLIGCGLGHTNETEKLTAELVENSPCPIILDADGINSLCPNIDVLYKTKSEVILTPHPAELARLCGCDISFVLDDRLSAAINLAEKYNVTVLAKGAETFAVNKKQALLIISGNTALAKGGSGDMLAGITASFAAQGMDLIEAGALASYIMGKTAECAAQKYSERGLLASEIIEFLPEFLKSLED